MLLGAEVFSNFPGACADEEAAAHTRAAKATEALIRKSAFFALSLLFYLPSSFEPVVH